MLWAGYVFLECVHTTDLVSAADTYGAWGGVRYDARAMKLFAWGHNANLVGVMYHVMYASQLVFSGPDP